MLRGLNGIQLGQSSGSRLVEKSLVWNSTGFNSGKTEMLDDRCDDSSLKLIDDDSQ